MKKTYKISEVLLELNELLNKYGDLEVYMDVDDGDWGIHSINYSTTFGGDKFISIVNYD